MRKKKILVTQNMAEPMWAKLVNSKKDGEIVYHLVENLDELTSEAVSKANEEIEIVSIVDNMALLNKINEKTGLNLTLNTGLRAEVLSEEGVNYVIYCISVTNLELYKYAKESELPAGANLQVIRYQF